MGAAIAVEFDEVGHPGEHLETCGREPVGVLAGQGVAAAEFDNRQDAPITAASHSVASETIASATANSGAALASGPEYSPTQKAVTGKADRRPARRAGTPERAGSAAYGRKALKLSITNSPGRNRLRSSVMRGQRAGQAIFVQGPAEIVIDHPCAEGGGVEEVEGLAVAQELLQRFGDRGQVDREPFGGGVAEQILLGQDGLAGARLAADQDDAVPGQTTAEDGVQTV